MPLAALAWLSGCVSPPLQPRSVLDPRTGITLLVADQPLIFARERRDIAVQARDYLTLVAAEINEAGRRRLLLAAHQWSTIDARAADYRPSAQNVLLLVADGRDLRLRPLPQSAAAAWADSPALRPPQAAEVVTAVYEIEAATLEYIATSHRITAAYPDSFALPFALWRDGRPAMLRLLDARGGPSAK